MAGFGVIKGLVRPNDFIIMDHLSHNCLQEGANAATKNIKKFQHLNQVAMLEILAETRKQNPDSAILVVTEGLFSMDSDSPDLNFYQKATKEHNAFLLVDCAHDFGHLGERGRGVWEVQNLQDRSNVILVGTGSKCLSTNIGFIGIKNPNVIRVLREMSTAYMHATVLNPAQAATSLAQLKILSSAEGVERRRKVLENYNYLRAKLEAKGHKIFGNPCAIMPVFVGNEVVCRLVSRIMMDLGTSAVT
jgi:glycine C-acetyltransferase